MSRSVLAVSVAVLGLAVVARGQRPEIIDETGTSAPKLVKRFDPVYTSVALNAKLTGAVHVSAVILTDGSLDNVHVVKSCLGHDADPLPHPPVLFPCVAPTTNPTSSDVDASLGLNDAAVDAVKKWTFQAGRENGKSVRVQVELVVPFRLP